MAYPGGSYPVPAAPPYMPAGEQERPALPHPHPNVYMYQQPAIGYWGFGCWVCPGCCVELFFTSRSCYGWTSFFLLFGIVLLSVGQLFPGISMLVVGGFCFLYAWNILKSREERILRTGAPGQVYQANPGYPGAGP